MSPRPARRLRRAVRKHGRVVGVGGLVVVVFAVALAYWARGADVRTSDEEAARLAPPASVAAAQRPSVAASLVPGPSSPATSATPSASGLRLPPLPGGVSVSAGIGTGSGGRHTVVLVATSDQEILRLAYKVRGAKPESVTRAYVPSPARITVTGTGDGLLAEIGVQASARATTITCTITVDGAVTAEHTSKGAYAVSFCVG